MIKLVRKYWRLNQLPAPGESQRVKEFFKTSNSIFEEEGVLQVYHQQVRQIILPKKLVHRVLRKAHDESGQFGVKRTLFIARKDYFW